MTQTNPTKLPPVPEAPTTGNTPVPLRSKPLAEQVRHWRDIARKHESRHKALKRNYVLQKQVIHSLELDRDYWKMRAQLHGETDAS